MTTSSSEETRDFDIKIAKISSANGLKGHVKLLIFLDDLNDILSFHNIFDQNNKHYKITPVSKKETFWIAKIDGIDSRESADKLKNTELYIKRSALPNLDDNQFYYEDMIGMSVIGEDNTHIGLVKSIENFGAGDLIEIQLHDNNTMYHPFSNNFVSKVDLKQKKIFITNQSQVLTS